MIKFITDKECNGCHACVNACPKNCINMLSDADGFWFPEINQQKCIQCGKCEKICPVIHKRECNNEPEAYACVNNNEAIRLKSSSGGVFTLLAEHIVNRGGIIFGAALSDDLKVRHIQVNNLSDIAKLRTSKYVQSKIGDSYKLAQKHLEEGTIVLFTGTPCQIGGLLAVLDKQYSNLICQDIICHGVPSPKVWDKYLEFHKQKNGEIAVATFKNKKMGWDKCGLGLEFTNGTSVFNTLSDDLMLRAFLHNLSLRLSCYNCAFKGVNRPSDITLADFWGVDNCVKDFNDDKGTSLVLVNTALGKEIFDEIKHNMKYKPCDVGKAISYNSAAVQSVKMSKHRTAFFAKLDKYPLDKLVNKYTVVEPKNKLVSKLFSVVYWAVPKIKKFLSIK